LLTITLWGGLGYVGGNSVQAVKKDIANIEQMLMVILAILVGSLLLFGHFKKSSLRKSMSKEGKEKRTANRRS
jgi:membrane protein DedA with SNARE-associated domain